MKENKYGNLYYLDLLSRFAHYEAPHICYEAPLVLRGFGLQGRCSAALLRSN